MNKIFILGIIVSLFSLVSAFLVGYSSLTTPPLNQGMVEGVTTEKTRSITLSLNEKLRVVCREGSPTLESLSDKILTIFCRATQPSPTTSPTPLATPQITLTPTPTKQEEGNKMTGKCGEPMDLWHPPVYNGCETGHEHGDPPPDWISKAGYSLSFHGPFNTSPVENTTKHTSMKGFLANFAGVEVYFRTHFASNPQERFGAYHSYEVFARDPSGKVSHWQGWNYSGNPTNNNERCVRRNPPEPCEEVRPIILVTDQTSLNQGITCEQWYAATAAWSWDFGITICGSTTVYQRDKEQDSTNAFDQSTWKLTGDLGLTRRLEAAWYGPDSK